MNTSRFIRDTKRPRLSRRISEPTNIIVLSLLFNQHTFFPVVQIDSCLNGEYVVDILEPHDPTRIDNLGKAKGFAEYARQNPGVGRIQLIRMSKDAVGYNRFKRLDMAMSAVRDKVSHAMTNDELDHIFDTDGFFMD